MQALKHEKTKQILPCALVSQGNRWKLKPTDICVAEFTIWNPIAQQDSQIFKISKLFTTIVLQGKTSARLLKGPEGLESTQNP
jgi:hypothetical protein